MISSHFLYGSEIGIDVGLKDFAILSTGERVANPRFARRQDRVLRRALSRTGKTSRNRAKARVRLGRIPRRLRTQRAAVLHEQRRRLIDRCHAVGIEDLNVRALATTKLRRAFADAAHGRFRTFLEYTADWSGKTVVGVARGFPSSTRCAACGHVHRGRHLRDRSWRCVCGRLHDRDHNAAVKLQQEALRLLAAGYPESQNAGGQPVRPAPAGMVG